MIAAARATPGPVASKRKMGVSGMRGQGVVRRLVESSAGVRERRAVIPALIGVAIVLAACSSTASSGTANVAAKNRGPTVTLAWDSNPGAGTLPGHAALYEMQKLGYRIAFTVENGTAATAAALQGGDVNAIQLNGIGVERSIVKGDPFAIFGQAFGAEEALVTPTSITSVGQLAGKTIGLASPVSSSATMVKYSFLKAGITVNYAYVGQSSSRADALLTGRIVGTPLALDDIAKITKDAPGKFHILVAYNKTLPWLMASVYATTRSFYKKDPGFFSTFHRLYAQNISSIYKNPVAFVKKWKFLLPSYSQSVLDSTTKVLVAAKVWGTDGGIVPKANAIKTVDFGVQTGLLTSADGHTLIQTMSKWLLPA